MMPQPQQWKLSGFGDMQLLQQTNMFKQLQELQTRKQLQASADAKQQDYTRGQFPHPNNGIAVRDPSQMFMSGNMNFVQHGGLPAVQGFPNGVFHQQFDASVYGAPVSSAMSQHSHMQGIYSDSVQGKSSFGLGLKSGVPPESFPGFPRLFSGKSTQVNSSRGLDTLDPMEEKILHNREENSWDASIGRRTNMAPGFGNTLEGTDNLNSFSSIQSGSWSALMQSAVAEASSSDTGLQEEWTGSSIPSKSYDDRRDCYGRENSSDMHHSNASEQTITGCDLRENFWRPVGDSPSVAESSGQALNHHFSQGPRSQVQGHFGQSMFMGNTSNGAMNLEKGRLSDVQRYSKASKEVSPTANVGANLSSFQDRSAEFYIPNEIVQPSQNMFRLPHKVDNDSDESSFICFGSADPKPQSGVPVVEKPGVSVAQQYDNFSAPQLFGSRLPPPSQRLPNSSNDFSTQSSPKTENSAAISSPGPSFLRKQIQMQNLPFTCMASQYTAVASSQTSSYSFFTNPFGQTQPSVMSGTSQQVGFSKKPPGVLMDASTQPSSLVVSSESTNNSIETTSWVQHELQDQNSQTIGLCRGKESGTMRPPETNANSLMAHSNPKHFDGSHYGGNQGSAVSARDLEAFACFSKPSHVLQQNYPLLSQAYTMMNIETDPSKRISEKYNEQDSDVKIPGNNELKAASQLHSCLSRDTNILSFSSDVREYQSVRDSSQPLHRETSHETVMVGHSYGDLKNGQILRINDARAANKAAQFPPGKPFESLSMNTDQNLVVARPKKRKTATSELLPWNKEVAQVSWRPESIRMAELEWARAANRLIEKVENDAKMTEDAKPMFRPKKRLISTGQLMQQVFRAPPASVLLAKAASNYNSVVYFAARLALGDACSRLNSCSSNDTLPSSNTSALISEKPKVPKSLGERYFSKTAEDFTNRAEKLETNFSRLDNMQSILDLRVESEELEKFCVMNRFAKFHKRGRSDAAGTSSSSSTFPIVRKTNPTRYVTGFPMPRIVPERAQCLSL